MQLDQWYSVMIALTIKFKDSLRTNRLQSCLQVEDYRKEQLF